MQIGVEGKLFKVEIQAFKDVEYKNKASIASIISAITGSQFIALLNPESYSESLSIKINDENPIGGKGESTKFAGVDSPKLNLKFLFDGTGVVQNPSGIKLINTFKRKKAQLLSVKDQIDHFKDVVFHYDGEIHQPHYLKINWGQLEFRGRLSKLNINYTLFSPNGYPLRAVAETEFISSRSKGFIEKDKNNSSPDLSHYRVVKAGDTLPLLTKEIYGDPKYYLEVARINKITNFRNLKLGTELVFPPIEKASN